METKDIIKQVSNVVDFFERNIKEMKEQEKQIIACVLNKKENELQKFINKDYRIGYKKAVEDIRDELQLNGIYKLYVDKV